MIPRLPLVIFVVSLVSVFVPGAFGQVRVTAQASSDRVYVGDGIRILVEVAGSKNPQPPTVAEVPGLLIELAGSQDTSRRQVMIVNGRRSEDVFEGYVFTYRVLAQRAGAYTIPPFAVVVDGREYQTGPLQLTALDPGQVDGFKLELTTKKQKLYVGEPVPFRITWYYTANAGNGAFSMAPSDGAFEILAAPPPANARGNEFTLFGKPAVAVQSTGRLEGEECNTISVDRVFVPRRAGKVSLGPIRLAFDVEMGRGIFGRSERKVIASNTLEFEVLPLPEPRPAAFNGLVGIYDVAARASSADVHVGDPITLTIVVRGPEPLDAVPAMDLASQAGFEGFKLSSEPMLPAIQQVGNARGVVFTTTIRAEHDNVHEIPAVELPYFNVETGAYGVARSAPIPLKVAPTTEVSLGPDGSEAPAARAPEQGVGGFAPIERSVAVLTEGTTSVLGVLRSPVVVAVVALPALAYLASAGVLVARRRAQRDPAGRRRRSAARRARRRLARAGDDPARIGTALRGYVADRFGFPEAGATAAECAQRLSDTGIPGAGEYGAALERCDAALYGGGGGGVTSREAMSLVDRTARELEDLG
jgi:hypothetical protein